MKILVTGATGFVGKGVISTLSKFPDIHVVAALRNEPQGHFPYDYHVVGDLDKVCDWGEALQGVDVVVHCAARTHVMKETELDPLSVFRKVNVEGTLNLTSQASRAGVRRFIFISSIKVNGESSSLVEPFSFDDPPAPEDAYGTSKAEAEAGIKKILLNSEMDFVIIRPPLIYGPNVKGNFSTMLRWVDKGIPLPLGAIRNARSLVALDNLVDLIKICLTHPSATNQIFLVSDGAAVSTTELLREIAKAMGKRHILLPAPGALFRFFLSVIGKQAIADRLLGSLVVDTSHTYKTLGWRPPVSLNEGLRRALMS